MNVVQKVLRSRPYYEVAHLPEYPRHCWRHRRCTRRRWRHVDDVERVSAARLVAGAACRGSVCGEDTRRHRPWYRSMRGVPGPPWRPRPRSRRRSASRTACRDDRAGKTLETRPKFGAVCAIASLARYAVLLQRFFACLLPSLSNHVLNFVGRCGGFVQSKIMSMWWIGLLTQI